jgi:hypothetical protein
MENNHSQLPTPFSPAVFSALQYRWTGSAASPSPWRRVAPVAWRDRWPYVPAGSAPSVALRRANRGSGSQDGVRSGIPGVLPGRWSAPRSFGESWLLPLAVANKSSMDWHRPGVSELAETLRTHQGERDEAKGEEPIRHESFGAASSLTTTATDRGSGKRPSPSVVRLPQSLPAGGYCASSA